MRGNVLDLAVGVVIGAAFGKIVSSLVGDVIMPPIGLAARRRGLLPDRLGPQAGRWATNPPSCWGSGSSSRRSWTSSSIALRDLPRGQGGEPHEAGGAAPGAARGRRRPSGSSPRSGTSCARGARPGCAAPRSAPRARGRARPAAEPSREDRHRRRRPARDSLEADGSAVAVDGAAREAGPGARDDGRGPRRAGARRSRSARRRPWLRRRPRRAGAAPGRRAAHRPRAARGPAAPEHAPLRRAAVSACSRSAASSSPCGTWPGSCAACPCTSSWAGSPSRGFPRTRASRGSTGPPTWPGPRPRRSRQGFRGVKLHQTDVASVAAAREAVGPSDGADARRQLPVDARGGDSHGPRARPLRPRVARGAGLAARGLSGARARSPRRSTRPIAAGENEATAIGFRDDAARRRRGHPPAQPDEGRRARRGEEDRDAGGSAERRGRAALVLLRPGARRGAPPGGGHAGHGLGGVADGRAGDAAPRGADPPRWTAGSRRPRAPGSAGGRPRPRCAAIRSAPRRRPRSRPA